MTVVAGGQRIVYRKSLGALCGVTASVGTGSFQGTQFPVKIYRKMSFMMNERELKRGKHRVPMPPAGNWQY